MQNSNQATTRAGIGDAIRRFLAALAWVAVAGSTVGGDLLINEVLFNPPGTDSPFEYLEFRGIPNSVIAPGTYFVAVEGDAAANPGTVQNVFDLSGLRVGGNGFLVLCQKDTLYSIDAYATALINMNSGSGWGTGSGSSVNHRGNNGITELKNPSCTYFLLQTTNPPAPGVDLDQNNDGVLEGDVFASWKILDSVGILDADGLGDFAYGAINFRRNTLPGSGAGASGFVVPVGFTPRYVGRAGNTTGSLASAWVAGDGLAGAAPAWSLGPGVSTVPQEYAGMGLDHIGSANFGAPALPGVVISELSGGTWVLEGRTNGGFSVALNTIPAGPVTIRVTCPAGLEVSAEGAANFASSCDLSFTSTGPQRVNLRATEDSVLDVSPRWLWITNAVVGSADANNYPIGSLAPAAYVAVMEKDRLLLNELKVNPPGTNDAPAEFVELKGAPGLWLSNVCVMTIEGDAGAGPGLVTWKVDLSGYRLGPDGLLLIAATNSPYSPGPGTTLVGDAPMAQPGGALGNGTITFVVVATKSVVKVGDDLDRGDNGVLEGLPSDAWVVDSLGWKDGDKNDLVYSPATLQTGNAAPDAATRLPWDETPNSSAAWIWGDLQTGNLATLAYDSSFLSPGFPTGTLLSPGRANNIAPMAVGLTPISGVIGDPFNPLLQFNVGDDQTPAAAIVVTASSSNPTVVPDANLHVTAGTGGARTLSIQPIGVGYADITLFMGDGVQTGQVTVAYAASAPGRPGGIWQSGSSDASTAIPIDDQYMVVGDDENQVLRVYERQRSGLPVSQFDMTSFLGLPDSNSGLPREVDVEASTRVGNRLFWLGSLGHAAAGEPRTNRTRVFATDLIASGASSQLAYAGRYDFLKLDLINWDASNAHGKGTNYFGLEASDADGVPPKAPDGSGLAIEGLAMMPGNMNGAYVAFRAPIVPATNRTFALVVPVLNFATLVAQGGPPGSAIFGSPIELDLYNRGIRSIEANTNGYLLIAGPAGPKIGAYPQDFKLYTWNGSAQGQPQQRNADLHGLNPEGIVEVPGGTWDTNTPVQLLSDGGATVYYEDDIQAKFLPIPNFKKFRSDWVALGSSVKPVPFIVEARVQNGDCTVRWRSLKGERYQVQSNQTLNPETWQPGAEPITATGPYAEQACSAGGITGYFRVVLLP